MTTNIVDLHRELYNIIRKKFNKTLTISGTVTSLDGENGLYKNG